jgi:hypothetical protein
MDEQAAEKANPQTQERIEVGYRNIGSALGQDYHHKFLLYTDRNGNQQTISGWTGEDAPGLPYGKMQVETNLPYNATNPDHPDNPNALGQRQYREPIVSGADLSQTWQKMVEDAKTKDDRYPYDPQLQNSNTLADSVVRDAGLPEPKQDGFTEYWAPASGRQLDEKIQPEVPGIGNLSRTLSASDAAPEKPQEVPEQTPPPAETRNDIRNPEHPGHERYQQALDAIEDSPNIPPDTFTGDRLEQAAANLANASLAGSQRPQGGQNEALDRIDFAVFNNQRDGLIAGQGEPGDPAAKLAFLPAAQDNATTLTMASQQVNDTLQRTQAQAIEAPAQTQNIAQEQDVRSIGPRMA